MRNPPGVALGAFLLVSGLLMATWPYRLARLSERLDAIGSRRARDAVEPADWNVSLARNGGRVLVVFGALVVLVNY